MKTNRVMKDEALASLKGNWPQAVLATFLLMLVIAVFEIPYFSMAFRMSPGWTPSLFDRSLSTAAWLVMLLVVLPLEAGLSNALRILLTNGNNNLVSNEFKIAFANWLHNAWTLLLRSVCVMLWTVLLIVPGVVKGLAYDMTDFIMVEEPSLPAYQAMKKSEVMMKGHKTRLFLLYLGMVGWALLSVLTLGLGLLWFIPYIYTTRAAFYESLKAEAGINRVDY